MSLPPDWVECFHDIAQVGKTVWFCTSDPLGSKLGSVVVCRGLWVDPNLAKKYGVFVSIRHKKVPTSVGADKGLEYRQDRSFDVLYGNTGFHGFIQRHGIRFCCVDFTEPCFFQ